MLIISKHRDYYDSAIGLGIDKSIIYNREEKKIKLETGYWAKSSSKNPKIVDFIMDRFYKHTHSFTSIYRDIGFHVISFCGKNYISFTFRNVLGSDNNGKEDGEDHEVSFSDVNEVIDALTKVDDKEFTNKWSKFKLDKKEKSNFINSWNDIEKLDTTDLHREYNSPVFVVKCRDHFYNPKMIVNPILKDYDFVKVYDPYTAFQEIQMYISGVLASGDDAPETKMNEKQKVNQHGFDDKYGFRTRPNKKGK